MHEQKYNLKYKHSQSPVISKYYEMLKLKNSRKTQDPILTHVAASSEKECHKFK
jgi:hypothetical protein